MSSPAGTSLEGWRLRRASARERLRPLRVVVDGQGAMARDVARRLTHAGGAQILPGPSSRQASDPRAIVDVVVICDDGESSGSLTQRVREVSLQAARACPLTAVVIASAGAMPLCVEAVRASGLPPWLVLAPGGMPLAAAVAGRRAASLGVAASQIDVPVVGGEMAGEHAGLRVLERYVCLAGIPATMLGPRDDEAARIPTPSGSAPSPAALAAAAARIARAVLRDSRRVLCCTAWVEGSFGLPGGFVTVPVPVGARGAETPLPLSLTLEERALLQRVAAR